MSYHAKLSPSSSARWLTCQASVIMQAGKKDTTSTFAAEGTAAHFLAEQCLINDRDAEDYSGYMIQVLADGETLFYDEQFTGKHAAAINFEFDVNADMVGYVQQYIDLVRNTTAQVKGEMLIEQKLPIGAITGEAGATGTSDAVILTDTEITVIDLKYGQGDKTLAYRNPQLMMYGLAALNEYELLSDPDTVRVVISQPRRDHVSEFVITADDLRAWGAEVRTVADKIHTLTPESDLTGMFAPSVEACKYCKAAGDCKAYAEHSYAIVSDQFTDISKPLGEAEALILVDAQYDAATLAAIYKSLPVLKQFVSVIENAAYTALIEGGTLPGYKLIAGNLGPRKWANEAAAEDTLKTMRVPIADRYKSKVISPTDAEKLSVAGTLGARQWANLQDLIVRTPGAPAVVPEDDSRNAINITPVVEQFDDLT